MKVVEELEHRDTTLATIMFVMGRLDTRGQYTDSETLMEIWVNVLLLLQGCGPVVIFTSLCSTYVIIMRIYGSFYVIFSLTLNSYSDVI